MKFFFKITLILSFLLFLIFQLGCKKNPVAFNSGFYNDDFYIQPGTYPSFETYFLQMNYDIDSPLPEKYLINYNLNVTHQIESTCVVHAAAHTLSINYQNRFPLLSGIQFDPDFIIDTAVIAGINLNNFQNEFKASRVIELIARPHNNFAFNINNILVNGCDVMWNYVKPDPISFKIAYEYSDSTSNCLSNVFQLPFSPEYDDTFRMVKIALKNNNALLFISPSSYGFIDGYVKVGTLQDHFDNHAITLIGWDDNFDFGRNEKGGFIFLNSYGGDWPSGTNNKGIGYISYDFLKTINISRSSFLILTTPPIDQNDFIGNMGSFLLKINETVSDPYVSDEEFSIDRGEDLSISFYQTQQSNAVLRFIDSATNQILHEMTIDSNDIRCLRRWANTNKNEYANTNIISSSIFGDKDEVILEYYINGDLKDRAILNVYGATPDYKFTKINGILIENLNGQPPVVPQGEEIELTYYQPFDEDVELRFGSRYITKTQEKGEHTVQFSLSKDGGNSNYIKATLGLGFTLNANGQQKTTLRVKGDYEHYDCRNDSNPEPPFKPEDFEVYVSMNRMDAFGEIQTQIPGSLNDVLVWFDGISPSKNGAIWFILEENNRGGDVIFTFQEGHKVYKAFGAQNEISPLSLFFPDTDEWPGALVYFHVGERNILVHTYFSECWVVRSNEN